MSCGVFPGMFERKTLAAGKPKVVTWLTDHAIVAPICFFKALDCPIVEVGSMCTLSQLLEHSSVRVCPSAAFLLVA